jgi:FtsZ-binding cell division protein ZapB
MTKKTLIKLAVLPLLIISPFSRAEGPNLGETRTALEQWVELRKLISEEATNWRIDKELMADTVDVLGLEMGLLEERILEAEGNTTEADKKREELTAENEILKEASRAVEDIMPDMEAQVRDLITRFPKILNDRIEQLIKRMPSAERARKTRVALGERVQNIVGILQEVEKFNKQITVVTELKALESGEMAQVKTVYIGLGQGYFVDENAKYAGVVRPTADGWQEEIRNDLASSIRDVVKIYENEKLAQFVPLPVEIN